MKKLLFIFLLLPVLLFSQSRIPVYESSSHIYYKPESGGPFQLDQQSGGSGSPTNGVTTIGSDFGFGGAFTQTTSINGAGFGLSLGTSGSKLGFASFYSDTGFLITAQNGTTSTFAIGVTSQTISVPGSQILLDANGLNLSTSGANSVPINLYNQAGTFKTSFRSSNTLASNIDYVMPATAPATGNVLYNTGSNVLGWTAGVISGSVSQSGTATTTFTVTIGSTLPSTSYAVTYGATSVLASTSYYITNKTTTTFDVVYSTGLTGTVTFDWMLKIN